MIGGPHPARPKHETGASSYPPPDRHFTIASVPFPQPLFFHGLFPIGGFINRRFSPEGVWGSFAEEGIFSGEDMRVLDVGFDSDVDKVSAVVPLISARGSPGLIAGAEGPSLPPLFVQLAPGPRLHLMDPCFYLP